MHISRLSQFVEPASELTSAPEFDGGVRRPVRAMLITLALSIALLVAFEAMSPGLMTRLLSNTVG